MSIETCGRCGSQTAKLDKCDYCNRKVCNTCIKSQKRKKIDHRYICKSCWSSIGKRSMFKSMN
jgi:methionyl-tRNA synthetase